MKVLIRVTDYYDGQEFGLEENTSTEQLEERLPFYLLDRVNELKRFIEYDIDKVRRRNQRENDQ